MTRILSGVNVVMTISRAAHEALTSRTLTILSLTHAESPL